MLSPQFKLAIKLRMLDYFVWLLFFKQQHQQQTPMVYRKQNSNIVKAQTYYFLPNFSHLNYHDTNLGWRFVEKFVHLLILFTWNGFFKRNSVHKKRSSIGDGYRMSLIYSIHIHFSHYLDFL